MTYKIKAHCEECTLDSDTYVPFQNPFIKQHNILIVGQAPGKVEYYTKVPFSGPAGKTHYYLLQQVGLNKQMLPHTNICACYPPGDRKPIGTEIECCFPRLKQEIQHLSPVLIVSLGEVAMNTLTGMNNIMQQRGRFYNLLPKYEYKCKVLCCLHPSFVMRQRQWIPSAVNNYKLILKFLNGTLEPDLNPVFTLDPSPEELQEYLFNTPFDVTMAVDTETTGLNTRLDDIIGYSFSKDTRTAVAVKFKTPKETDPRWAIIEAFLEDKRYKKCWQNGSFDTEIARTYGIHDEGFFFDTRLAQQMLHSDLPSNLDFLRSQYTNIPPYKPSKKDIKHISNWGAERMLQYAAWDAVTTKAVMKEQFKLLDAKQIYLMQDLLIPLVRAIGRMERRGNLVDKEALASLYLQCAPEMEKIEEQFKSFSVNPRSPKQLKEFFNLKTTQEDEIKRQIKRRHPKAELMQKLLEYRKLHKVASVYLKGIYQRLENDRTHPHYKIEGTGTGRLASENPNMQNIPEELRVIYISDPDYILINADYSQLELWVGAVIAGEDQMLKDLQDGLDIHYIACQLCFPEVPLKYGNRKQDFTHSQQTIAKTINFGTFYGRTPLSIAREFGVTVAEAESWQKKILNKYPNLSKYKRNCEEAFRKKGYLKSPFGRIRYITSVTQGYNFPVQSAASDITLYSIKISDENNLWCWATVHDSIVYQVPLKEYDKQLKLIKSIIERPIPELDNVRFKADYKKGYNWYEMTEA